jgi:hypothetical protein
LHLTRQIMGHHAGEGKYRMRPLNPGW